ncbi:MAG: hypothetical protein ACI8T1_003543 [Verrucomicrobiales bacterium]|jgi:hypothetical protein
MPISFSAALPLCVALGWAVVLGLPFDAHAQDRDRLPDPVRPEVEATYMKGLAYLVGNQTAEGCWRDRYGRYPGVVGLAVMAMLAHGDDPNSGPYQGPIKKGLDFILQQQDESNGFLGDSMYNHGFATIAVAEAYGVVDDDRLGLALKKATELILSSQAQNPRGAWRYQPEGKDADTTVSGAQMVALFAARNAGILVPDEAITRGLTFFTICQSPGGGFGYSSPGSPNVPRTAISLLVYALAHQKDTKGLDLSYQYLIQDLDFRDRSYPFYYEYYMAQALFQWDPKTWEDWDRRNVPYLAQNQESDGSWKCSHGETFATSAALLSMALNYRYLPIYER